MRIMLDTNAYTDWRRSGRWNQTISTATEVWVPAIVVGELCYGFKGSSQAAENERKLGVFLGQPVVKVLGVNEITGRA